MIKQILKIIDEKYLSVFRRGLCRAFSACQNLILKVRNINLTQLRMNSERSFAFLYRSLQI